MDLSKKTATWYSDFKNIQGIQQVEVMEEHISQLSGDVAVKARRFRCQSAAAWNWEGFFIYAAQPQPTASWQGSFCWCPVAQAAEQKNWPAWRTAASGATWQVHAGQAQAKSSERVAVIGLLRGQTWSRSAVDQEEIPQTEHWGADQRLERDHKAYKQ